jgi:hypothetical protein
MTPVKYKLKYLNDLDNQMSSIRWHFMGMMVVSDPIRKGAEDAIKALEKHKLAAQKTPAFEIGDIIEAYSSQYEWSTFQIVDVYIVGNSVKYKLLYNVDGIYYSTIVDELESFRRAEKLIPIKTNNNVSTSIIE